MINKIASFFSKGSSTLAIPCQADCPCGQMKICYPDPVYGKHCVCQSY
ncbi:hypothetical protein ACH0BF_16770 [Pseudobacillus sp. 179-B 2D1 NHS]